MGYSLAWVAVRGLETDVALARLHFSPTGRTVGFAEAPLSSLRLATGWLLVVADGGDDRLIKTEALERLSVGCEVVACLVEEHVMASSAEYWDNGRALWRVEHDSQHGPRHLVTRGALPPDFEGLRAEVEARQNEEDPASAEVDYYFDVPLRLAQSRTGFKYDELDPEIDRASFTELNDLAPAKAWYQFWK